MGSPSVNASIDGHGKLGELFNWLVFRRPLDRETSQLIQYLEYEGGTF